MLLKSVQVETPLRSKDSDSLSAQGFASVEYDMKTLDTALLTLSWYRIGGAVGTSATAQSVGFLGRQLLAFDSAA
jgi:hypothetical protein